MGMQRYRDIEIQRCRDAGREIGREGEINVRQGITLLGICRLCGRIITLGQCAKYVAADFMVRAGIYVRQAGRQERVVGYRTFQTNFTAFLFLCLSFKIDLLMPRASNNGVFQFFLKYKLYVNLLEFQFFLFIFL